jgi:hypothetical protein
VKSRLGSRALSEILFDQSTRLADFLKTLRSSPDKCGPHMPVSRVAAKGERAAGVGPAARSLL